MFRKQHSLIGLAILVVAASPLTTTAQTVIANRQLPASALRTMKPQHAGQRIGNIWRHEKCRTSKPQRDFRNPGRRHHRQL